MNEAILKAEHSDSAQSALLSSLKLLIWAQGKYSHVTSSFVKNREKTVAQNGGRGEGKIKENEESDENENKGGGQQ